MEELTNSVGGRDAEGIIHDGFVTVCETFETSKLGAMIVRGSRSLMRNARAKKHAMYWAVGVGLLLTSVGSLGCKDAAFDAVAAASAARFWSLRRRFFPFWRAWPLRLFGCALLWSSLERHASPLASVHFAVRAPRSWLRSFHRLSLLGLSAKDCAFGLARTLSKSLPCVHAIIGSSPMLALSEPIPGMLGLLHGNVRHTTIACRGSLVPEVQPGYLRSA